MDKHAQTTTNTFSFFTNDIKKIMAGPGFLSSIEENIVKSKVLNITPPSGYQEKNPELKSQISSPKTPGFVPIATNSGPPRPLACNCKYSQCIKLYCECFRNGSFCKNCSCKDCSNESDNEMRASAIAQVKQKNPNAFEPKFKTNRGHFKPFLADARVRPLQNASEPFIEYVRGCNCRNSNCQKKYCECYQHGVECSSKCKCQNCQNGNHERVTSNGFRLFNGSGYPNLNQAEIKHLLLEKLLDIKRTKFPRAD